MTKEQEEAIKRLEEQLNFWKKQNIKNSDCEIILNLVTKLQKENNKLKHNNRILLDEEKNYIHTEQVHNNQIQQLKKQIDLMAEVIFKRFTAQLVIEYGIESKEELKKIFENKAKEKGE